MYGRTGRYRGSEAAAGTLVEWAPEEFEPRLLLAGTPTQVVFTTEPSECGSRFADAARADSGDSGGCAGNPVTTGTAATEHILLTISAGPSAAAFAGNQTAVTATAVAGIANITSLSFTTTGMYTLTASGSGLAGNLSNSFSVGPSAAKLVFIQGPLSTTAGNPFSSIIVGVEDSSGNLVTTDASNVTLAINSGGGTLTGTTVQSTLNSNGEATFNGISISKSGTYTLIATDPSLTASTISGQFTISAGTATKLGLIQQPTNTPQSSVITPTVTVAVEDQFGNIVTTDNSAVSLALMQSQGRTATVLDGTTTENAVNGVASFNELSIPGLGTFQLQASDSSLNQATSAAFAVTGPPAELAFQRQPSSAPLNSNISPPIVVLVEDCPAAMLVATDNSAGDAEDSDRPKRDHRWHDHGKRGQWRRYVHGYFV